MVEKNNLEHAEVEKQKDIEYFSALVTAWLNTRLEQDKSILALSAGAIGLLVTLLTTIGPSSKAEIVLYLFAFAFYLISICCVLWVFQRNSQHIEQVLKQDEKHDTLLSVLDYMIVYNFILGIVFTMAIGIFASVNKFSEKGGSGMSEPKKESTVNKVNDSFNEVGKLKPIQQQTTKTETTKNIKK